MTADGTDQGREGAAARVPSSPGPSISVVIPAFDEEDALPGTLESLRVQVNAPPFEVVLADGGSGDATVAVFESLTTRRDRSCEGWLGMIGCRVVHSPQRGRALQMNAGARASRGAVLLFLHADTALPPGALAAVEQALRDPGVVAGGFRHRFRERGALLSLISFWSTLRSVIRRVHYGDQAMFVRRVVFESVGGFEAIPLFEDLRLAQALRRAGTVRTLPLPIRTSARRLRAAGVLRTGLRFAWLRLRFALGSPADALRREYPDIR